MFAAASTGADLSSALPYFAAVDRVAAEMPGSRVQILALLWYNLLYCAPMIALVVVRLTLAPDRSEALFGRMRAGIDWAFVKLLPPLMATAAVGLVIDGARRL